MDKLQQEIWDNSKLEAMARGYCIGGCAWLNTDEATGQTVCVSDTGCMWQGMVK